MQMNNFWNRLLGFLLGSFIMVLAELAFSLIWTQLRANPWAVLVPTAVIVGFLGAYTMTFFSLPSRFRDTATHNRYFWNNVLITTVLFTIIDIIYGVLSLI
ncbi:MAG: hypothetical protein LBM99_03885 [Bacillales bacterium]|jgi:hypothetical protein|nr:hypothetical protein [Bacillales bacterium]